MIINFAIILATVVPNGQGKYIELLSNEEFQYKIARRAEAEDDSNEDIGNRDDKSYIPDIDLALTDDVQSYTGVRPRNSADNANFNKTILPLQFYDTFDDYNKNTTEEKRVNQEKNTPDSYFSDTTLAETSVILSTTTINSDKKTTTNIEAQAPEHYLEIRVPANYSTVDNIQSILKTTVSHIHDSSNSTLTDKSTTDSVIDTTTYKNADVFTTHNSGIFTAMAQNTGEVNTATTEYYNAVIINSLRSKPSEDTRFIPALPPIIEEEQRTKKPVKIDNTIMHAVKNITKSVQCLYCYKVYDLLGPTKRVNQPFLRSQDQPHFHHVYKNLRNFANYNPNDSLNEVEEKSIELHKRQVRERNNDIDDTVKAPELLTAVNNESRKFIVFKKKNKIPNISDKMTVQYQRQGSNREKAKVKKGVRLFDDTNIDILPELMHTILGVKSMNFTTFDSYKGLVDMDKYRYARLDNLFDLISVTDDIALFQHSIVRKMSNDESKINIHLNVLKDLILEDSKGLKQYDWLATTVQIESALTKMLKLIKRLRHSEPIHLADLEILKYVVFLHNFSLGVKEDNKLDNKLNKITKLLPTNKRKRKNKLLKDKGLIKRVWLYLTLLLDLVEDDEFSNLYKFFIDVQDGLFGLHEAIRHIADVTKFDRQDWYGNLKQLYLSTDEKHLRELLLHISMSRLVDLVENSCKQGLDNDVIKFLQTHEEEAKRIVEEMLFIGKIVDEI